jgi:hypothetical protein
MKRRRVVAGLVVVVVVAVVVVILWPRGPRLSTFKRVQPGMTRGEVYASVGGPPGNYTGGTLHVSPRTDDTMWEYWASRDAMLFVRFGEDDRVVSAGAAPMVNHYTPGPTWIDRLLDSLGL